MTVLNVQSVQYKYWIVFMMNLVNGLIAQYFIYRFWVSTHKLISVNHDYDSIFNEKDQSYHSILISGIPILINPEEASREIKAIFEKNNTEFKDVVEVRVLGDYENLYKTGSEWKTTKKLYV
jgi:hypothetical protein